jgi:hypothetical protein
VIARKHAIRLANTAMEPTALALPVRAAAHRESLGRYSGGIRKLVQIVRVGAAGYALGAVNHQGRTV